MWSGTGQSATDGMCSKHLSFDGENTCVFWPDGAARRDMTSHVQARVGRGTVGQHFAI